MSSRTGIESGVAASKYSCSAFELPSNQARKVLFLGSAFAKFVRFTEPTFAMNCLCASGSATVASIRIGFSVSSVMLAGAFALNHVRRLFSYAAKSPPLIAEPSALAFGTHAKSFVGREHRRAQATKSRTNFLVIVFITLIYEDFPARFKAELEKFGPLSNEKSRKKQTPSH